MYRLSLLLCAMFVMVRLVALEAAGVTGVTGAWTSRSRERTGRSPGRRR
jgi:hypothetical protein